MDTFWNKIRTCISILKTNPVIIELTVTILPAGITFAIINRSIILTKNDIYSLIRILAPTTFIVFSFYLPRAIDEVKETNKKILKIEKNESSSASRADELFINKHADRSRILFRCLVLTSLLLISPVILNSFKNSTEPALIEITKYVISTIIVLLSVNLTYFSMKICMDYYNGSRLLDSKKYLLESKLFVGSGLVFLIGCAVTMLSQQLLSAGGFAICILGSLSTILSIHLFAN